MTDWEEFENPKIINPDLASDELAKILSLQGEMLKRAVTRRDHEQTAG